MQRTNVPFFFFSRSTFIAYGPIENQFVEFMWPARVSEMMQYGANAATRWYKYLRFRHCGRRVEVKLRQNKAWKMEKKKGERGREGGNRGGRERETMIKLEGRKRKTRVKNAIVFVAENFLSLIWFASKEKKMNVPSGLSVSEQKTMLSYPNNW